ncbi:MAG: hypothetical protein H2067_01635 [Alcanivorax sp.]|uniref:hypothetical protein n=1 Tax=Alloalcanivorax xenomutans TaxID=1094342 RepID=UPI0013D2B4F2|nr:hypothetical protein [Alcanivorax sp.]
MEVKVNTKKEILKSFIAWLPIAVVSLIFYGTIFIALSIWVLKDMFGIEEALAQKTGWATGIALLSFSTYILLKWQVNKLASYHLSITNEILKVKGITGWRSLDIEVPTNTIREINIGQSSSIAEELLSGYGTLKDQTASRLNFFPASGKPFNLEFAAKAFNNESLYEFLTFAKSKGIKTNIRT